jgi:mRNA interferase MazF
MLKEFDNWNEQKKCLHKIEQLPMFSEREVWWCSLGVNVGDEQDGKGENFTRPVLVLKKFNRNLFVGVPMSTKIKELIF